MHLLLFSVSRALWTFYTELFLPLTLILHSLLCWLSVWKWSLLLSESSLNNVNNVWSQSPLSPGVLTLLTSDCVKPSAGTRGRAAPTRLLDSGHQHTPPGSRGNWFLPGGGGRKGAGEGGQVKRRDQGLTLLRRGGCDKLSR